MDSLPDIDIDSGLPLDDLRFRGEIAIKGVEFTYQMRPENKVREEWEAAKEDSETRLPVSAGNRSWPKEKEEDRVL